MSFDEFLKSPNLWQAAYQRAEHGVAGEGQVLALYLLTKEVEKLRLAIEAGQKVESKERKP